MRLCSKVATVCVLVGMALSDTACRRPSREPELLPVSGDNCGLRFLRTQDNALRIQNGARWLCRLSLDLSAKSGEIEVGAGATFEVVGLSHVPDGGFTGTFWALPPLAAIETHAPGAVFGLDLSGVSSVSCAVKDTPCDSRNHAENQAPSIESFLRDGADEAPEN